MIEASCRALQSTTAAVDWRRLVGEFHPHPVLLWEEDRPVAGPAFDDIFCASDMLRVKVIRTELASASLFDSAIFARFSRPDEASDDDEDASRI